uniref:Uncharacterized protein n=1 Tax=Cryptosporidium parvum TaxID=5807 RepID=F0X5K9_CRYPV
MNPSNYFDSYFRSSNFFFYSPNSSPDLQVISYNIAICPPKMWGKVIKDYLEILVTKNFIKKKTNRYIETISY